jgi:hypothetical protein
MSKIFEVLERAQRESRGFHEGVDDECIDESDFDLVAVQSEVGQKRVERNKLVCMATSLTCGALIMSLVWWTASIAFGGGTTIDQTRGTIAGPAQKLAQPLKGSVNREGEVQERGDALHADAIGLERLPPAAAGEVNRGTLSDANQTAYRHASESNFKPQLMQTTVDVENQLEEPRTDSGSWVINLASLKQEVEAEVFLAKVGSKGVHAEITQVIVKGKTYWRVQVPGFSSAEVARTNASEIQDKLGLNDVWVLQRL